MQRLQQQQRARVGGGLQIGGCISLWLLSGRRVFSAPDSSLIGTTFAIIGCVGQHFHVCFSVAAASGLNPQGTSTCTRQTGSR